MATYLNDLRLDTGDINATITVADLDMKFNNRAESIPGQYRGVAYPVSGEKEQMSFEITIWGRGNVWQALSDKRQELINVLRSQVREKTPILVRDTVTAIYEGFNSVYVLVDDVDFPTKGKDGANLLDFKMTCIVLGAPASEGGNVEFSEVWTVESC